MPGVCKPYFRWPMPDREIPNDAVEPAFLPYGRQEITDIDVKAVVDALVSGWLTTGPRVSEFEQAFASHVGAGEGVAVYLRRPRGRDIFAACGQLKRTVEG